MKDKENNINEGNSSSLIDLDLDLYHADCGDVETKISKMMPWTLLHAVAFLQSKCLQCDLRQEARAYRALPLKTEAGMLQNKKSPVVVII